MVVSQPLRCLPAGAGPSLQAHGVVKLPHHGRLLLTRVELPPAATLQPFGLRLGFGRAPQ